MKLLTFFIIVLSVELGFSAENGQIVACYFTSWSVYRPSNGSFGVSDIDGSLCTHIYYSFIGVNEDATVRVIDPWESGSSGLNGFDDLIALKESYPDLNILVSMGGWNEGSYNFSVVAADSDLRTTFVTNVVAFLEEYSFDGLDLDWQYPGLRDSASDDDPDNFLLLLEELKSAFADGEYLLTVAVSGGISNVEIAYPDIATLSDLVDLINVMTFDFHGDFEEYVGHPSPLHASSLDTTEENSYLNVDTSIQYWIDNGASPSKLLLGVITYGRTFTLSDTSDIDLYASINGSGTAGPYTNQAGILGFNEICEYYESDYDFYWDDEQKVPHLVSGDQWIGYETTDSIAMKVEYAKDNNLGGIMVWSLDTDDFRNVCGNGAYPLINEIVVVLNL